MILKSDLKLDLKVKFISIENTAEKEVSIFNKEKNMTVNGNCFLR